MAPELETERLTFRGHRIEDLDESFAMWSDPAVVRHIGGRPFTREEVWQRLLRYVGHWALSGHGFWVLREKTTGLFVGEVGMFDGKRELTPALRGPELGWALAPWAHGRGFATEAVQTTLRWGEQHFGKVITTCIIDHGNLASVRVADKCGFKKASTVRYHGEPIDVYERLLNQL